MKQNNNDILNSLPVVALDMTLELYLRCLKPVVNNAEYVKTKNIVYDYYRNQGVLDQKRLEEYAYSIKPNSWLMPHSKDIYLKMREPISLTGNYCFETVPFKDDSNYSYLQFTAVLAYDIVSVFLENVVSKDNLENSQIADFLIKQREIAYEFDREVEYDYVKQANSFGVFYKNHFYTIRIIEKDGTIVHKQKLLNSLDTIYNIDNEYLEKNFGILGFAGSDMADEIITYMSKNAENVKQLKRVNQTLFNITLNDVKSTQQQPIEKYYTNTSDIWPYKGWSISVYQDLVCLINNEHSFIDGVSSVYLFSSVFDKIKQNEYKFKSVEHDRDLVNEVEFVFNEKITNKLQVIKEDYLTQVNDLVHKQLVYYDVPVKQLRSHGINIDYIFQLSFLYAQYYAFNELEIIHESVSVTQYYQGRTNTLQSISDKGITFVKAIHEQFNNIILIKLLKKASDEHVDRIRMAKEFCSIIRFHSGLNNEIETHEIFLDKNFLDYKKAMISTSSFGNNMMLDHFAFAPTIDGGVGIGYLSSGNTFKMDVSYYHKNNAKMSEFLNNLDIFFNLLNDIFG